MGNKKEHSRALRVREEVLEAEQFSISWQYYGGQGVSDGILGSWSVKNI